MSTGAIIGIVIVVIVVVAAVVVASREMRRARLRRQFGPEYDRLAQQLGNRSKADAELAARQRRVEALGIHELSPEQQASYSGDWTAVQERFVDTPAEAVAAAGTLIWGVMRDRGYPTDDRDASMDALSFYHAGSLESYRQTLGLRTEAATTEQLREAMISFRALFEDLTGLREGQGQPERDRVADIRDRAANSNPCRADSHRRRRRTVASLVRTVARRCGERPSRGERQPDRRHASIGAYRLGRHLHTSIGTHGEMIPMTQDQYGQTRGPGYVVRDDAVPDDENEEYATGESKPMTRFQKVASALRGGGPERDEEDQAAQAADPQAGPAGSAERRLLGRACCVHRRPGRGGRRHHPGRSGAGDG